jgi:hypothetical protein
MYFRILITIVSVVLGAILASLIATPRVAGLGQEQDRVVDKESWRTEPIKIIKLKTMGKPIELGKKFSGDENWLKGLTVTVENVSNKGIARIELELIFPRVGGGSSPEIPILITPLGYGRDPAEVLPPESLKMVLPGESVDITLPEVNLPFIEHDLKRLSYPEKTTHARIRVNSVTFIDGSEWAGDVLLYPDPKNPKNKINPNYPSEKQVVRT